MKTELKFYEVKEGKKYKTTFYRNNYYEVSIRENLEYDYISCNVSIISEKKYLPRIYIIEDTDNSIIKDIEIDTISYGALSVEGIKEVNSGYILAIMTANEIKRVFNNHIIKEEK